MRTNVRLTSREMKAELLNGMNEKELARTKDALGLMMSIQDNLEEKEMNEHIARFTKSVNKDIRLSESDKKMAIEMLMIFWGYNKKIDNKEEINIKVDKYLNNITHKLETLELEAEAIIADNYAN